MTRKDYVVIAEAIHAQVRVTIGNHEAQSARLQTLQDVAAQLVIAFTRDNARFIAERFYRACGLKGGQ